MTSASTAVDHVRADLAWHDPRHGTDGNHATLSRGRKGTRNREGHGTQPVSREGATPHADRNNGTPDDRGGVLDSYTKDRTQPRTARRYHPARTATRPHLPQTTAGLRARAP
jgi:hypothetical protein